MAILPVLCNSMDEIRDAIDEVDVRLLDLFAERQRYIDRAAVIKMGSGIPVRVPERIEFILSRLEQLCQGRGLDPDLFRSLWGVLIEHAIAREASIQAGILNDEADRAAARS
jgi:chorismate mutase-like protein